ncbi:MAG: hypothetical protein V1694_09630 [Candidatus Eisenbacteria bacterium]
MRRHAASKDKVSASVAEKSEGADDIRDVVAAGLAYYADWFKRVESRPDSPFHGVYNRFERFAKEAAEDLKALAEQGVSPHVIICLMFEGILMRGDGQWETKSTSDWRKLSSYNYWRRGMNSLRKADKFLSEFGGFPITSLVANYYGSPEFDPFVKVCQRGIETAKNVHEFLAVIEDLNLHEPGWTLKSEPGQKPLYRKTDVIGRKKSGKAKKDDWGLVAAKLHEYFMRSTGKPHWGVLPRLLHFAGFESFPTLILSEGARGIPNTDQIPDRWDLKNKVRSRVQEMRRDPAAMRPVERAVDDFMSEWKRTCPAWWTERFGA